MMRKSIDNASFFVFLLIVLFLTLLLRGVTLPFVGLNAWNFNTYSLIAVNYISFGYFETLFAPIVSVSKMLPDNPSFYLHHPQLLSVVQSVFMKWFGNSVIVARLPVLISTVLSLFTLYKIAHLLKGKVFACACLVASLLMPGFYVFGRMIGQEAFVLFFVLLTTYFLLLYLKTRRVLYLLIVYIGIILGILSDWPMVYFVVSLFSLLFVQREFRLYAKLLAISVVVVSLFLLYINVILGGYEDLIQAFLIRSPGALLQSPLWFVTWPATITFRILLYFNPLVVVFSVIGAIISYKEYKQKSSVNFHLLLTFLLYGFLHIFLYPEGSFGHAYWIFYLVPFFVFASSYTLASLLKERRIFVSILIVVAFLYALMINEWKIDETKANVFRFYTAKTVSDNIPSYTNVFINNESLIDPDLMSYHFSNDAKRISDATSKSDFILYSCIKACGKADITYQKTKFGDSSLVVKSEDGEAYLFLPDENTEEERTINLVYASDRERSLLGNIYSVLKSFLSLPQI